jgi:DNA-binding transcriptional regulator YhcF (GntR family)
MSLKLLTLVYDGFPKGGSDFDVLLALADSTHEETGRCFPSIAFIAWKTRQSERTVQYALKNLARDGWIKPHKGKGQLGTNLYVLNRRKLEAASIKRKAEYDEIRAKKNDKSQYQGWDDDFGVEIPQHEEVQKLQVQKLHPCNLEQDGVQSTTQGVQLAAAGGATSCTLTREPEENQIKPSSPLGAEDQDKMVQTGANSVGVRHKPCRDAYEGYWNSKNTIPMPWGKDAAGSLANLLRSNPRLTVDQFVQLLRNRYRSDVNHAERPVTAISLLTNFASGPLDIFNKPKNTNGGIKSEQQSRQNQSNDNAIGGWLQRRIDSDAKKAVSAGEFHS